MDVGINSISTNDELQKLVDSWEYEDAGEGEEENGRTIERIELVNKHPELEGFGLDISGGKDRPYIENDPGIFVSAIKQNGIAENCGKINIDDKIIEVNGHSVVNVSHDEAVRYFIADRKKVKLVVHKFAGQLLRAASATPTPTCGSATPSSDRSISPRREQQRTTADDNNLISVPGLLLGIAFGCISIVILKRYLLVNK